CALPIFCVYGLIENVTSARAMACLPIGLSEGCVLLRDKAKNEVLSLHDVERPVHHLLDALWQELNDRWPIRDGRMSRHVSTASSSSDRASLAPRSFAS